ncbi:hypothetical protein L211DRAFT_431960 [Terfezia boudieri ATCC MYA-4762]|uniref:Uncharacterized protein n=1 Tax=Terfezia boudieri ATCC MYA-4762 TaxID=1051890 RepID=A0A3N4LEU1_9PEZI|nr:hypothetical protein L211DRAFT_431960 [Terfezia boudieri ATCC MYA-4762]
MRAQGPAAFLISRCWQINLPCPESTQVSGWLLMVSLLGSNRSKFLEEAQKGNNATGEIRPLSACTRERLRGLVEQYPRSSQRKLVLSDKRNPHDDQGSLA